MDDGTPTLEVGFAIDAGGSFESLEQLDGLIDRATANAVAEFAKVERASKGMLDLGGATASMTTFGAAATRELQSIAREKASTEKAGESLIRQLDREAAAFGKTRDEIRAAKIETVALAAVEQSNTDLAERLRSREAALYDLKFAAMRKAQAEAVALGEAETAAAAKAVVAADQQAQALREAALAYNLFEAAARRGAAAMRDTAAEAEATRVREAAYAYQMFEAAARKGAAAMREVDAAQKAADASSEADRLSAEAAAAARLADEHARLAALVRGSHDAQEADAVAAERMREATDPLYAAVKRLNAEIAESTRLYHNGATAPAEYARQQDVLAQRLRGTTEQHELMAAAAGRNANAMRNLAIQMPDVVQGLLTGQKPFTILIQQGGQLVQVAMMAEGGLKAMAMAAAGLAVALSPLIVAAGIGFGAIKLFQAQVKDGGDLTHFRDNLGLTHKEMLELSDGVDKAGDKIARLSGVTVTVGDVMTGIWKTVQESAGNGSGWSKFEDGAVSAFKKVLDAWSVVSAGITAAIYGTVNAAKVIWSNFASSVGDVFYQATNFAIEAMNKLVKGGTDILNGFIHAANKIPGLKIGDVAAPQIAQVNNPYAGAMAQDASKAVSDGYKKAYADAKKADADFWKQVGVNAQKSARDRMSEEAAAIKANRTPPKPKVDKHAEELARDAAAVEAQIKNLYALADAYGVSGAAALIAEARVKAESQAIKQRADIDAAVARQVSLAIAQRVSDAEKSASAMRDQAAIQADVNGMVAAGNVPAERAAELVQERIAELPLLAAIEAAQQLGLTSAADRATKALNDQRDAQLRVKAAAYGKTANSDDAAAAKELATLAEELRLVGATDVARVHSLATLKATQEAEIRYGSTTNAFAQTYIANQVAIADAQQALTQAQNSYNDALNFTADKWDLIAQNVQTAGQGMADAFGTAGKSLGDLASTYANYEATRARLGTKHDADIKAAGHDQAAIDRANQKFALSSATAQVGAFGDMAEAAKGFFDEKSKGYQVMQDAEKAFRAIQFAMSVKAMAQDAIETGTSLAKSAARTAAHAVETVVKAISSLPFPLNIAAGAATIAALAAIGVSVVGSLGGGSSKIDEGNTGTGTVLGDSTAKSDSIKNALDALKNVDTLTNTYAREMSASLKSIDSQIGGVAAQIVQAGDVSASAGVTEGFKTNIIGSVLSKIPLIGGILGSLFGSTTTVTGNGLYGGAQSVGSIMNGGFDASYYSDIQKKSKFLGITTGTKNSTQYSAADPTLTNQFTLILKQFDESIAAAAGPLGVATSDVQARLNSFVVDIGKIDLKGLTGEQIQEKLTAVFGAAADGMASAAFPAITQFQKVGEGAYETLVRVASTIEAVGNSLDLLGQSAQGMGIAAKLGLADQFDSVSDLTDAAQSYFQTYYSAEEQVAAKTSQMAAVFGSLGLAMPATLAAFRQLVEAQDLTTSAGQATYATLLKLAPAFADLQTSMDGAKSAADILSERTDLQRQLLELNGDTAAIRALDLAKLDASNRALQEQVWAVSDAQDAAKAAADLASAWSSVGDSITTEINRIRGLSDTNTSAGFASLQGQFNAATAAARAGDMDAAKSLPELSQALLTAAAQVASSRQELDRIQGQTAASLEATNAAITGKSGLAAATSATSSTVSSGYALVNAATLSSTASTPAAANDDFADAMQDLRDELAQLRTDMNSGNATIAANTGGIKKTLDNVTARSGGTAITIAGAA